MWWFHSCRWYMNEHWMSHLTEFLPETVWDLLLTETWFPSAGTCDEGCVSDCWGITPKLGGTRAARSGGWSLLTVGLACKGINKTTMKWWL